MSSEKTMKEWELNEAEIAEAIKASRKDPNRTYARYRAVVRTGQEKLLNWLKDNGYIDNSVSHLKLS